MAIVVGALRGGNAGQAGKRCADRDSAGLVRRRRSETTNVVEGTAADLETDEDIVRLRRLAICRDAENAEVLVLWEVRVYPNRLDARLLEKLP